MIKRLLGKKILMFDGAMGTLLQSYGLESEKSPELLNFSNPEMVKKIHSNYIRAGADFISTNTFGAFDHKLKETKYTVEEVIDKGVSLAREAVWEFIGDKKNAYIDYKERKFSGPFVALSIGPSGLLMEPLGSLSFDDAYNLFKRQVTAAEAAGADLILFETFTDIYEMKAAILAAKENCSLPIFCSLTFQENGRTLMGSDVLTTVNVIQELGVDAIGLNCCLGPREIMPIVKDFLKYTHLPVIVQPNAGLPEEKHGEMYYPVNSEEFMIAMREMADLGVAVIGGCCGTTPEYIARLSNFIYNGKSTEEIKMIRLKDDHVSTTKFIPENSIYIDILPYRRSVILRKISRFTAASSGSKTVVLDNRIRVVGERINPSGKKDLQNALKEKDDVVIEKEALSQVRAGAEILDVNVSFPGAREKDLMLYVMKRISFITDAPIQIDSDDPDVIESAVRIYNGNAIINSVNGKASSMDSIFPIAKKYGSCIIALAVDENGLPESVEDRINIIKRILMAAQYYGIPKERMLVDCLSLPLSSNQGAVNDTLEAMRTIQKDLGVKTILGISNVSYGMPDRNSLNKTFLSMALASGLDVPIINPLEEGYMDIIRSFEALSGKDIDANAYLDHFSKMHNYQNVNIGIGPGKEEQNRGIEDYFKDIILNGNLDIAKEEAEKALKTENPMEFVNTKILPLFEDITKEYSEGIVSLPQLMKISATVKAIIDITKDKMKSLGDSISYGRIIVATVQGDLHDIGKNIGKVVLENYGYEIIDLGKDVSTERIVNMVKRHKVKLVGLSALMTGAIANMEITIKVIKENIPSCKVFVSGAVLTKEYAEKIGADYYCKTPQDAVEVANEVFKKTDK